MCRPPFRSSSRATALGKCLLLSRPGTGGLTPHRSPETAYHPDLAASIGRCCRFSLDKKRTRSTTRTEAGSHKRTNRYAPNNSRRSATTHDRCLRIASERKHCRPMKRFGIPPRSVVANGTGTRQDQHFARSGSVQKSSRDGRTSRRDNLT